MLLQHSDSEILYHPPCGVFMWEETSPLFAVLTSISFCFSTRADVCKCGYSKTDHVDEAIKPEDFTGESWDRHRHIREVPTDAVGDISFGGLGQKTGQVKPSFLPTAVTIQELLYPHTYPCLRVHSPVCASVHRHQPWNPVPVIDRSVETFPSQPADLSDRRSQELLPEGSSQDGLPQRSH